MIDNSMAFQLSDMINADKPSPCIWNVQLWMTHLLQVPGKAKSHWGQVWKTNHIKTSLAEYGERRHEEIKNNEGNWYNDRMDLR
jgi:hypothetical protein